MTSFDDGSDEALRASQRPVNSSIARFYKLSMEERRARLAQATGVDVSVFARFAPDAGLSEEQANLMVENAVGVLGMPIGVCMNMRIDGEDVLVPMAVEEPSVVAACSYASKLLREGGGVTSEVSEPLMVGQLQVLEVRDPVRAERAILAASPSLLALADSGHKRLCGAGGGARSITIRHLAPLGEDDPCGPMLVVHLLVDVREAMGANAINSMCERLAPRIEELTGGRVALRILSNLSDQRTVTVIGRVPFSALDGKGTAGGEELARRIEEASVFAERDPYRACTHNKGIMNGVDAALIALGQDWRAVEAGAHAFAARGGRYTAMATWRVESGCLVGRMTIPMAVGTVGGVAKVHPVVGVAQQVARTHTAARLAAVCASAGLAQNLGALRALAAEGIQRGHMRLHARNVAVEAGANADEVEEVARRIADAGRVNGAEAERVLLDLREPTALTAAPPPPESRKKSRPPVPAWADSVGGSAHSAAPSVDRLSSAWHQKAVRPRAGLSGPVLVLGDRHGVLGANLIERLVDDGYDVRVMVSDRAPAVDPVHASVERVTGEVSDPLSLRRAMDGCHHVFLLDGDERTSNARERVLERAHAARVRRVVETQRLGAKDERSITIADRLGLDLVIVELATVVGRHDLQPSPLGQALIDFTRGRPPLSLFRDSVLTGAADAVDGLIRAMERGAARQRYVLRGEHLRADEIVDLFEEVSGQPRPAWMQAPILLSRAVVRMRAPAIDVAAGELARRELGVAPTGVRAAMHAAYEDLAQRGLLPNPPGMTRPKTMRPEPRRTSVARRDRAATGA